MDFKDQSENKTMAPSQSFMLPVIAAFLIMLITWILTHSNNTIKQSISTLNIQVQNLSSKMHSMSISKPTFNSAKYLNNINPATENPSSTKTYNFSLIQPAWHKQSETIIFLHIVKCGGTSVDRTLGPLIKKIGGRYKGHNHFDWSYITKYFPGARVITQLRDPVDRFISNFYHGKKLETSQGKEKFLNMTLSDYIRDTEILMQTRSFWHDGQGGVHWLSGTHPEVHWVDSDLPKPAKYYRELGRKNQTEYSAIIKSREIENLDMVHIMKLAAAHLRETIWFGVLEEGEKSYEMLSNILGLDYVIELTKHNMGGKRAKYKRPNEMISNEDKKLIERLIPMDIWLYEYGKILFEARYRFFKSGVYIEPALPKFPAFECSSTRYALKCNTEPEIYYRKQFYYREGITDERLLLIDFDEKDYSDE